MLEAPPPRNRREGTPAAPPIDGDALAQEIFADACGKIFACECDDYGYADPAACVAAMTAGW